MLRILRNDVLLHILPLLLQNKVLIPNLHDGYRLRLPSDIREVVHHFHIRGDGVDVDLHLEALRHQLHDLRGGFHVVIHDKVLELSVLVVFDVHLGVVVGVEPADGDQGEVEDGVVVEQVSHSPIKTPHGFLLVAADACPDGLHQLLHLAELLEGHRVVPQDPRVPHFLPEPSQKLIGSALRHNEIPDKIDPHYPIQLVPIPCDRETVLIVRDQIPYVPLPPLLRLILCLCLLPLRPELRQFFDDLFGSTDDIHLCAGVDGEVHAGLGHVQQGRIETGYHNSIRGHINYQSLRVISIVDQGLQEMIEEIEFNPPIQDIAEEENPIETFRKTTRELEEKEEQLKNDNTLRDTLNKRLYQKLYQARKDLVTLQHQSYNQDEAVTDLGVHLQFQELRKVIKGQNKKIDELKEQIARQGLASSNNHKEYIDVKEKIAELEREIEFSRKFTSTQYFRHYLELPSMYKVCYEDVKLEHERKMKIKEQLQQEKAKYEQRKREIYKQLQEKREIYHELMRELHTN